MNSSMSIPYFETIKLRQENDFGVVQLARGAKFNAISTKMWEEFKEAFQWLDKQNGVQAVRFSHFCCTLFSKTLPRSICCR